MAGFCRVTTHWIVEGHSIHTYCPSVTINGISFHSQTPGLGNKLYGHPEPLPALDLPSSPQGICTQNLNLNISNIPQSLEGPLPRLWQWPTPGDLQQWCQRGLGRELARTLQCLWSRQSGEKGRGEERMVGKKEKERNLIANPTSRYHFSCLKSKELRLPRFLPQLSEGTQAVFMVRQVINLYLPLPESVDRLTTFFN